ncbi:MAG: L-serine ammonia-lyase [Pseudomonadota bacterium]
MQPGVFDIFKIGVGPSSSHTMGPMIAAARFLDALRAGDESIPGAGPPARLGAVLHGSLAFTGKGHATDRAVLLGLMGFAPDSLDPDRAEAALAELRARRAVTPEGLPEMALDPETAVEFDYGPPLPGHANGLVLRAWDARGTLKQQETYYSVGGGFVLTERELERGEDADEAGPELPYPYASMADLLETARATGLTIARIARANADARYGPAQLDRRLDAIAGAMRGCVERGLSREGELPGGLRLRRRAKALREQLEEERRANVAKAYAVDDWLACYAMAVNEENAAGGRVVTAPTNGAAGVFPAVMIYYLDHVAGARREQAREMLLVGAAVGAIIKRNASISGAEVGCQGEVGSASAMAAAALAAAMGGSDAQVENAAEIALEHHLGMTCDPAKGLVQVPCIERNAMGAVKAAAAASLALRGDGRHFMPLDNCIETMRQTGIDMDSKYKETSLGGLAVNLPEC